MNHKICGAKDRTPLPALLAASLAVLTGVAGCSLASPSTASQQATKTRPEVHHAAAKRKRIVVPVFRYSGDPQCAITYSGDAAGGTRWVAYVTVPGQIITHVSDNAGNLYRRVQQITPGPNAFAAPFPVSQLGDIGGVLYDRHKSYGCSIAPEPKDAKPKGRTGVTEAECYALPAKYGDLYERIVTPGQPAVAQALGGGWAWDVPAHECLTEPQMLMAGAPADPRYCTQVGLVSANPGYNVNGAPAPKLAHVLVSKGGAC